MIAKDLRVFEKLSQGILVSRYCGSFYFIFRCRCLFDSWNWGSSVGFNSLSAAVGRIEVVAVGDNCTGYYLVWGYCFFISSG